MKLTNAIADWTDKKLLRMDKVIRISYEKMAEMIITEYISCSDEIFRKKTLKTLKGGLFLTRKLKSKNERYILRGSLKRLISFSGRVLICIIDTEEKILYKPEKNIKYSKKIFNIVKTAVENNKRKGM